ncbi:MAG: type I-MYXAN CRISPR-associated protein Cas5/Cmx5/DevS [Leptospiraceae bacterium]|nr:type I-MYXAN CRISPR-associated protein Cas5/Cmx5/DevS [Leptospiraceae bacterium]
MKSDSICLYVSVPIACFRASYARTFAESLPVPAPSTVYGMLLSMIGEKDRDVYKGAKIAIALLSEPERSTILRKMWRVKIVKAGPGIGSNATPDFQELLSGTELLIWIMKGNEQAEICLKEKVENAIKDPASISRFGSLCLGESTHLVDEIRFAKEKDKRKFQLLNPVTQGQLSLPIWVDHVGSYNTRWMQFNLDENINFEEITDEHFISITA